MSQETQTPLQIIKARLAELKEATAYNSYDIGTMKREWLNLLKVIELQSDALNKYTEPLPWKEVTHTLNTCGDDCPRECNEHSYESKVRQRSVSHGSGIAREALTQTAQLLKGGG